MATIIMPVERHALTPLPLSRFTSAADAPLATSPHSLPHKRPAPSTPGTPERERIDKASTRKRSWRTFTPRETAILTHDDLGVGKSPARKLCFMATERQSSSFSMTEYGVSGIVAPPSRTLAPSPPIAESSALSTRASSSSTSSSLITTPCVAGPSRFLSPETVEGDNGTIANVHYPGFAVLHDEPLVFGGSTPSVTPVRSSAAARLAKTLASPASRMRSSPRSASNMALSPSRSAPATPSRHDNQENIPPASNRRTPGKLPSPRSSPIKLAPPVLSRSSGSDPGTAAQDIGDDHDDESVVANMVGASGAVIVSSGGGGTGRRRTGKSKLDQVFAGVLSSDDDEDNDDDLDDDLTPGRLREPRKVAKERMLRELSE